MGIEKENSRGKFQKSSEICFQNAVQQSGGFGRRFFHIPEKEDAGKRFAVTVYGFLFIDLRRFRQTGKLAETIKKIVYVGIHMRCTIEHPKKGIKGRRFFIKK